MKLFHLVLLWLLLVAIQPALYSAAAETQNDCNGADTILARIIEVADGFPPKFKHEIQKKETIAEWNKAEEMLLTAYSAKPNDYSCLIRLGDLYRMGHNLDIMGADFKTIEYLKKAMTSKPKAIYPHILLGKHYTFGLEPVKGEKEYFDALKMAKKNHEKAEIYGGLSYAYYFQQKYQLSNEYAIKYLEIYPNDKYMKFVRQISDEAMRGIIKPKIIKYEAKVLFDKLLTEEALKKAVENKGNRKDVEYLNTMFKSIGSKCHINEINSQEIVGLKLVSKGKLGMVIYNGKMAGVKGLKNEIITYQGIVDFDSYKKDAKFIKFYEGCD